MPLQSFTVTEDFIFELCQFKQQNSADKQTDRQTKYCRVGGALSDRLHFQTLYLRNCSSYDSILAINNKNNINNSWK